MPAGPIGDWKRRLRGPDLGPQISSDFPITKQVDRDYFGALGDDRAAFTRMLARLLARS